MCWPAGKHWIAMAFCVGIAGVLSGCATPRRPLFAGGNPPLFWPVSPETPRIRYVGEISSSYDLGADRSGSENFLAAFRGPRPPIAFKQPHAVDRGAGGLLAVADIGAAAVHIIDLEKRTHTKVIGWGGERFKSPSGVAWADRRLYVCDAARAEIIELNPAGAFQNRFGGDLLNRPAGVCFVPPRGQLFVVDTGEHRIEVFEKNGRNVRSIGVHGSGQGEFNYPTHIACNGIDRVAVSDSANFRVQLLDLEGRFIRSIGHKGDAAGDLSLPKGVAFDRDGHVFVVDARFENFQVFDAEGRVLLAVGEEGSGPGQFSLPAGLSIDRDNRVWVADARNGRIEVFDYLGNAS